MATDSKSGGFGFGADLYGSGQANTFTTGSTEDTDSSTVAEGKGHDVAAANVNYDPISASARAETHALLGGYDDGLAQTTQGAVGVGVSEEMVQEDIAAYTQAVQRAVDAAQFEGKDVHSLLPNAPHLSGAEQDRILQNVAQQNGTSVAELEAQHAQHQQQVEQAASQTMGAMFSTAVASQQVSGNGVTGALDNMTGQNQPQQSQQQASNPFGISNDVLASLRGTMVDFGEGTKGFAAAMEQDAGYSRTVAFAQGFGQDQAVAR